jgi:starch synthase
LYSRIKTLFTIHNIEYQGVYSSHTAADVFGIPRNGSHYLEYNGACNIMKGALQTSDAITTVSRTYAGEIMDPFYSNKLDHALMENSHKIKGILNGIDTDMYDPSKDTGLFKQYDAENPEGKELNKAGLQKLLNLPENPKIPLISMVTRLTGHKGIDLVNTVIEDLLSHNIQMVILGQGEWQYETRFKDLEKKYPSKFKAIIAFSNDLAVKIYAGSDIFLMPSKSEPCGLAQMISMRYGTIPVVRETGGLKDTVIPYNPDTKKGNGLTFSTYDAYDMIDAIKRALSLYGEKEHWAAIMQNAFSSDFSWRQSAREYKKLYMSLVQ